MPAGFRSTGVGRDCLKCIVSNLCCNNKQDVFVLCYVVLCCVGVVSRICSTNIKCVSKKDSRSALTSAAAAAATAGGGGGGGACDR